MLLSLLILLAACGGDGVKIDACDDSTDSTLDCQICCEQEGCDPDRAQYVSGVQFGCTCFPLEGDTDTGDGTCE
ncbi:MAG: hypothetical protein AAFV53_33785 [Myxococcota bacterium]